jgi:hypothetical protein
VARCGGRPPAGYPIPDTVGLPAGWHPVRRIDGDLTVSEPGAELVDVEVTGNVNVMADGVFLCRVRVHGRVWTQHADNAGRLRQWSVTVEDSTLGVDRPDSPSGEGVIGPGRYTIRRSVLYGVDGFRISAPQGGGPNDVEIVDNYFRSVDVPCSVGAHIDGVQGYGAGQGVMVNHNTIDTRRGCGVTSAVFFADDSESAAVVNNLLMGGGYTLRVHDDHSPDVGPWVVVGNQIAATGYGPVSTTGTDCDGPGMTWADNRAVTVDDATVMAVGGLVAC